mgnify:CR=1 FL=1
MPIYLFHRGDSFYPLELTSPVNFKTDDQCAIDNALCNEGTTKVDKIVDNEIKTIWNKKG